MHVLHFVYNNIFHCSYMHEVPCTDSTQSVWVYVNCGLLWNSLVTKASVCYGSTYSRKTIRKTINAKESCILGQLLLPGQVRNWVVTMVLANSGNYLHCWILRISHKEHHSIRGTLLPPIHSLLERHWMEPARTSCGKAWPRISEDYLCCYGDANFL